MVRSDSVCCYGSRRGGGGGCVVVIFVVVIVLVTKRLVHGNTRSSLLGRLGSGELGLPQLLLMLQPRDGGSHRLEEALRSEKVGDTGLGQLEEVLGAELRDAQQDVSSMVVLDQFTKDDQCPAASHDGGMS